ncbi:hypothetical protein NBRC10513_006207 [Rhodotorula toruloides]
MRLCEHRRITLQNDQAAVKLRLKHLLDKIKETGAVVKRFHLRIRFNNAIPYGIDDFLRGQSFLPLTEVHEVTVAHPADLCEVCDTKSKTAFKTSHAFQLTPTCSAAPTGRPLGKSPVRYLQQAHFHQPPNHHFVTCQMGK